MTLRLAACVATLLCVTILSLYLQEIGRAPWSSREARHLRQMKDRTTMPTSYEPMRIEDFGQMPRRQALSVYAPLENRGVVAEGYVQRMLRAPDGDIHLDFAPELGPGGRLVPYIAAEVTPQWRESSGAWRYDHFVAAMHPRMGGATRWEDPPRRVRLRGWLMYDYPGEGGHPVAGFPSDIASWEIHPVTGIEVWDDSSAHFVEMPR